jgi:hypothetical protein
MSLLGRVGAELYSFFRLGRVFVVDLGLWLRASKRGTFLAKTDSGLFLHLVKRFYWILTLSTVVIISAHFVSLGLLLSIGALLSLVLLVFLLQLVESLSFLISILHKHGFYIGKRM